MRDHPVGSIDALRAIARDDEGAYALGLWCADGYHRSSSIGITNVDARLARRFMALLTRFVPRSRLRWRVYYPVGSTRPRRIPPGASCYPMRKLNSVAYQGYVNCRPLLRSFRAARAEIEQIARELIPAYFAGRFDGDGSVARNRRNDLRITYSNREEAEIDHRILDRLERYRSRVYHYRTAGTYVLYVSRWDAERFLHDIAPHSVKVRNFDAP